MVRYAKTFCNESENRLVVIEIRNSQTRSQSHGEQQAFAENDRTCIRSIIHLDSFIEYE